MLSAKKPLLVVITGLPCAGKTTIGRRIAQALRLPYIYKDGIKECLFDSLGWSDREWSKKLGDASYALLYHFLETQMLAGRSVVAESNFSPEFAEHRISQLITSYQYDPYQILCVCQEEVLWERFKRRSENGERHPGHVDHLNYETFRQTLRHGNLKPLDIGGELQVVDTTDLRSVDCSAIVAELREYS